MITAIFCSTVGLVGALGYDLWDAFVRWTDNSFRLSGFPDISCHLSLTDALEIDGITENLAPEWVPEGYELLDDIQCVSNSVKTRYRAVYYNDDNEKLIISVTVLHEGDVTTTHEKDDGDVVIYTQNEINHYIMTNYGQISAVWAFYNYECSISGALTEIECEKMIDSVY